MQRKHEWIARKLESLSYPDLASLSRAMDEATVRDHGNQHSSQWSRKYTEIERKYLEGVTKADKLEVVLSVLSHSIYSTPCMKFLSKSCKEICSLYGQHCMNDDSTFHRLHAGIEKAIKECDET